MGKLTARGVGALKEPGRYADGDGLYLFIDSGGRKYWQLRYMLAGRRRDMAIGPERRYSLAQAREEAMRAKLGLSRGIDPLDARKEEERSTRTFAEAAKLVHAANAKGWRIGKHQDQWLTTLENHAFPVLGNKPVAKIERADVVAVLAPIWLQIPETARRVRQRIGVVIDWAVGSGIREHGIDMRLVTRALPRQSKATGHFAAMHFNDVPVFLKALTFSTAAPKVRAAIEMMILTASRPGNIRMMAWDEIDLDRAVWTIPKEKMKTDEPHSVPLAPRALELLGMMHDLRKKDAMLVFHVAGSDKPMSLDTMRMTLRRLGYDATAHGFRSSFKEWSLDADWPDHLSEAALAHTDPSKTRKAYARSDLLEKRKPMMEAWAHFVMGNVSASPLKKANR